MGVSSLQLEANTLPNIPLVVGDLSDGLTNKVNLATAKSIVVVTEDEMINTQIGLMAQEENPHSVLIIRTSDSCFSDDIQALLQKAKVLCVYALAAEVFVAAAFGEKILDLIRLNDQTILVKKGSPRN